VIDVLDGEIELVVVLLGVAAILRAAIRQHPAQHNAMLLEERQHPIVQNLRRGEWRLAVVELGEDNLGVGARNSIGIPLSVKSQGYSGRLRARPWAGSSAWTTPIATFSSFLIGGSFCRLRMISNRRRSLALAS
jgi:hypothetical protein